MKYLESIFLIAIFSLSSLFALGCHDVTVTETSALDNGDGTYTYTFEVCFGTDAGSETYGFWLDFTGGNLVSYDPSVTGPTTGNTKTASVPSVSGNGTIEYGDWDDDTSPLLSGTANSDCLFVTLTFDDPITDVTFGGTQPAIGCAPLTINTTVCYGTLTIDGTVTDATSGCASDGEVAASASNGYSPYSYSWDNGDTGSNITGLAPGDYTVTVTDAEGCTENATYTVGPDPDYTVVLSSNCGGPNDASFTIDDSNGTTIGSATQVTGTNTYLVCGCGASATLNYGTKGGNACTGVSLEVFDAGGSSLGTATNDGETFALDCLTLPVESDKSEAVHDEFKNANRISWSTLSETNNDYFTISYSNNGENWKEIQKIAGAGNSSVRMEYETYHRTFDKNEINYYKIVQTDYDGTAKNVAILSVHNRTEKELIKTLNLMGQEVGSDYKGVLIRSYSDGSTEKVYSH